MKLEDLAKKDQYNFLSPYGLGDTMMLCGFADAWEKKHAGKIHFIIKPSHEVVMKMYGITNYSIYRFQKEWYKPEFMKIARKIQLPQKGEIFVAHPHFHQKRLTEFLARTDHINSDIPFDDFYREFLDIPMDSPFTPFKTGFSMSLVLREKLKQYGSLENIVLFLPEAQSLPPLSKTFWKVVKRIIPKEKVLIQNVMNHKNEIPDIPNVDMTIEEVIALASACYSVFAYRSGMCDLIAPFVKKMVVFFPELHPHLKKRYSLKQKNVFEYNSYFSSKTYYLFHCLPLIKVISSPMLVEKEISDAIREECVKLFPFLKILKSSIEVRYFLFNCIPVLKIQK